jgi:Na+-translocating ferredoxin:NAD+ oxidoreductase RNF subunit RnfB
MADTIYEKVADAVNARTGYPCRKCPELFAILEFLYNAEEAELAVKMPMMPTPAAELARDLGDSPERLERVLEGMADKALVFTDDSGDMRKYVLVPLLPGTFEVHFMRGGTDERTRELARLFQNYFTAVDRAKAKSTASARSRSYTSVPFSRVISVEVEIPAGTQIHPYDKVSKYIEESELISIGTCYCRHYGELIGNPCTKPKDNCFSFGFQAKFMLERGFNKPVTKEEARRILDEAEKAGLVHCSTNTSESINFICNCCSCHCGIMESIKAADSPNAAADSSFIMRINEEECIGCGDCVERCQVDAITLEGDKAVQTVGRCIGCGLCISTCTSGALELIKRGASPEPPRTLPELTVAMIASYQQRKREKAKETA